MLTTGQTAGGERKWVEKSKYRKMRLSTALVAVRYLEEDRHIDSSTSSTSSQLVVATVIYGGTTVIKYHTGSYKQGEI